MGTKSDSPRRTRRAGRKEGRRATANGEGFRWQIQNQLRGNAGDSSEATAPTHSKNANVWGTRRGSIHHGEQGHGGRKGEEPPRMARVFVGTHWKNANVGGTGRTPHFPKPGLCGAPGRGEQATAPPIPIVLPTFLLPGSKQQKYRSTVRLLVQYRRALRRRCLTH
jgi:hypothetical protein